MTVGRRPVGHRPLECSSRAGLEAVALRYGPDQDLLASLQAFCEDEGIEAACILAAVGSLHSATIRLASGDEVATLVGPFEILSLSGTLSRRGSHVHVSLADKTGKTVGGHLKEGCPIFTTLEVVVGVLDGVSFRRAHDPRTGWPELEID